METSTDGQTRKGGTDGVSRQVSRAVRSSPRGDQGEQEAAIKAVRSFTETVDKTLAESDSPTQAEQIVDSALKMADKLVETQYTFLKKVVHSAGESLGVRDSSEKK